MADDNPIGTSLVFEDDRVRIWRIELAPGEEAPVHTHLNDYTTVVVDGDVVERPNADGSVDRIEVRPGSFMRWHQGTIRHSLKNVGSRPFHNVIVELKNTPVS
ncbi:MAG: hypothetical protein JO023_15830 [Chloroflexi bacterium]|nr:hypothetical protein [Chloroflexota bacterium]